MIRPWPGPITSRNSASCAAITEVRAWRITAYGDPRRNVKLADVPPPQVGPRDVLIRVAAASLNPIDFKFARGKLRVVEKLRLPALFGFDASGSVAEVGAEVS